MNPVPIEIRRLGTDGLSITWSDESSAHITSDVLRKHCPCAECKMKRGEDTHSTPLTPKKSLLTVIEHTREESISLQSVAPVGQYAISIAWGDGHDSGIYTYSLLYSLSKTGRID